MRTIALFEKGKKYPPEEDIHRVAKYKRNKAIFDNKLWEVYDRATELLDNDDHRNQLMNLYISIAVLDILCTKPADLLVGEPPKVETGKDSSSREQQRLNEIVENNDLTQMIHEMTVGNAYRGDAFIETYFSYRQDFSGIPEELSSHRDAMMRQSQKEVVIEPVNARYVFAEFAQGSKKRVKAINVAWPETVDEDTDRERYYLHVKRHVPGAIIYKKFKLYTDGVFMTYGDGAFIDQYIIGDEVETGRASDVELTGVPHILVEHIPYKKTDDDFYGISLVEKLYSNLAALNDRITQIDYILWKHADPAMRGPDYGGREIRAGGKYYPYEGEDNPPEYLTWNAQLESSFKEIDLLLGTIFQIAETPQWLFGTTLTPDSGGTGTSHTDGAAIRARFMPILSKVKRIRMYVDRAMRDALYKAQMLENFANRGIDGWQGYDPVYPTINWSDGLPKNEKELAEIMAIRTGDRPTLDQHDAIKRLDDLNDDQAREIKSRIEEDQLRDEGTVDSDIFRQVDDS